MSPASAIPLEPVRVELSAGAVVYRRGSAGVEVLLIKDRYGNWGLPKGHVEEGETSEEAAIRECREETGLDRLRVVGGLGTIDWYFRFGDSRVHKFCDYYLIEADTDQVAEARHEEGVQVVRWAAPADGLAEMTYENARTVVREGLALLDADPGPVERPDPAPAGTTSALTVFLTGGTGFVGSHIARDLAARGHRIRALVRDPGRAEELESLGADLVSGDVTRPQNLADALDGCDAAIHLVGIIREKPPRITYRSVHVEGTRNVVEAAARAGVSKYVHMSALGAKIDGTEYHRTKYEAEEVVRRQAIPHVILRPSTIVGEGSAFLEMLSRIVRLAPVLPVIGDGQYRLQPVDVRDLARAFVLAAEREDLADETFEIGGPHKLTYNRMLEIVAEELDRRRSRVHIPLGLARPLVDFVSALRLPTPINSAELRMLLEENVVAGEGNALREVFGLDPTPFRAVIQRVQAGDER